MFTHYKPRYSIVDTIDLLCSSRGRIYDAIKHGRLETYKISGRRFVSPAAIDKYVEMEEREAVK
jgi:hypothetical protein